ncbi:hypothetical protein DRJ48_00090 [Candidatus Woesearchaeota archaeon]|nr:S1 RNA-binding domain-containing protein [Candidatus Woesearchaeota archaeon]RLE43729.1 MAG: hypothetical protein DRJ48_00090 [Candidatus Woesearchaeota archaeon]
MLLRREGLPEEGELLLCEVKKVHFHSVFVKILEYRIEGMIHISEIAPGRIRNIRDYVREGKYIVCKALRVNKEKRQVDLSLRRVNERERREKTNQISLEKRAEKIVELAAEELKMDVKQLYSAITQKLFEEYEYLYDAFVDVVEGRLELSKLGLDKKIVTVLERLIKEKIKPPRISIRGHLKLTTYLPDGIALIKESFKRVREEVPGDYEIKYEGGGAYSVKITGKEYETCEKILKSMIAKFEELFSKNEGSVSFARVED